MRKNPFWPILVMIVILSAVIRFWNFDHHFLFGSDASRDILVARGAVAAAKLPWVGSFSSAGPFVFGPNWYWFLMIPSILAPGSLMAPALLMVLVSLAFVAVMGLVGRVALGRRFGLVLAILTAVSPAAVSFSAYTTQHAFVEVFAGLALLGLVSYLCKPRLIFAFLTSLSVGAAISMHYQALNLLIILPLFYFMERPNLTRWVKLGLVLGLGLIIFPLPLLLWDSTRGFSNLSQLIYYFRVGQYRFWVSNRWLTYLGLFWPNFMGKMIGGNDLLGYVLSGATILGMTTAAIRKKLSRTILFPLGVLGVLIFLLRYFRGERFEGYLIYFHPLVLFAIAAGIYFLISKYKWLLGGGILILFIASMVVNSKTLAWDNGVSSLSGLVTALVNKYPGQKVSVYGRTLYSNCSSSFSALLDFSGAESDSGKPVGVCRGSWDSCTDTARREIARASFQGETCVLVDLTDVPKSELTKAKDWYYLTAAGEYDDVQNWWRKGIKP